MRCCEIIVCPHSEKGERRQPRKRIKNYQPAFEQRERKHPKIHNEQVAEQKRRPLRDRFKREQIERRAHRHRSKPDPAGEKFRARFPRTLRPRRCCEKEHLKSGKYRHDNQHFVSSEIFFGNKERPDPGELHQCSSHGAESRKHIPALSLRKREQTDIEQRDVDEKSERVILTGRKQHRREKTTRDAEHSDDDRIQPDGEQERDGRDQRHQQKGWNETEEREVVIGSTRKRHGVEHKNSSRAERLRSDGVFFPS